MITKNLWLRFSSMAMILIFAGDQSLADWPQAAGPHGNYQVRGNATTQFSVAEGDSVLWRVSLPNTGESTPIISSGRLFVTCHAPIKSDSEAGAEILGMCFDIVTGKELWRRSLPGTRSTDMASGFSDNTAASPVTDGQHVCFINVGGSIQTYDYDGRLIWQKTWVPFGRHHARQQEPILLDGKVIFLRTVAQDLPIAATTKEGAKPLGRDPKYWTRLHAYDLVTGDLDWIAESASSVHSLSMHGVMADGGQAILTGRGGGHQPPEEPYGLSLIDANSGKTRWDLSLSNYAAHQNAVWNQKYAAAFIGMEHHLIDISSGKILNTSSINKSVTLCRYQEETRSYTTEEKVELQFMKLQRPMTYHTNCMVGQYHYFRSHEKYLLGRVNMNTGDVDYLQVPAQVLRKDSGDVYLWDKAIPNDCINRDGFIVYQDRRATLDGWGHVSAASPIVVGDFLYMPTMLGTVYVIRWNVRDLNETAIESISDLGPAGETWSLSSLSYHDGRLYARTMKELICLGASSN